MTETKVFSEGAGSPRIPSASFARVDPSMLRPMVRAVEWPRRAGKTLRRGTPDRLGPLVQVSRELYVLDELAEARLRARLADLMADLCPAREDISAVRSVVARHAAVSFHREEVAASLDPEPVPSRALLEAVVHAAIGKVCR